MRRKKFMRADLSFTAVTREDFRHAVVQQIKSQIPFANVGKFLPFQTQVVSGNNFNHIQSLSAFAINTDARVIQDGDTLCGRKAPWFFLGATREENCPGCEAIGQGLAVRDLL